MAGRQPRLARRRAAFKAFLAANVAGALTDMHLHIQQVISAADKVVLRLTSSGTSVDEFMGNAPTGNHPQLLGVGIYTIQLAKQQQIKVAHHCSCQSRADMAARRARSCLMFVRRPIAPTSLSVCPAASHWTKRSRHSSVSRTCPAGWRRDRHGLAALTRGRRGAPARAPARQGSRRLPAGSSR